MLNKKDFGFLTICSVVIMNFGPMALSFSILINFLTLYWHSTSKHYTNIKPFLVSLLVPFFFIIGAIFTVFLYQNNVKLVMYIAIFIYLILVTLTVLYIFYIGFNNVQKSFRLFIIVSFFIVISQQIVFVITGEYLDIHSAMTLFKAESRYFSPLLASVGLIRPTGWTVEPSNMSAILTFSTVIYYLIVSKIDRVVIMGLACAILTFSFAAIIIVAAIFFFMSIRSLSFSKLFVLSTPLVVLLSYFVYYRVTGGVGYDSLGVRMEMLKIIEAQDIENLLLGNGFFALQSPLNVNSHLVYDYNIRDSGLWPNLVFSIGVIPTVVVVCSLFFLIRDKTEFFIIFFALFSKFDYFQPFFWFFVLIIIGFYINGFKK